MSIIATRDFSLPSKEDIPTTYPPGRRCARDSCPTILNRFNPGPLCLCHTPDRTGVLIETGEGFKVFPLESLISRQKLSELVPNRG